MSASSLILPSSSLPVALPAPRRGAIVVREASLDDLPFIDALQKRTTRQVGFLHKKALEGKIARREVLVAESVVSGQSSVAACHPVTTDNGQPTTDKSLGYLIATDRYQKHDDVGIIYQINVIEGERRGLVAATLLKAQFDRSAYGCRLYCCWCAQDLEANRFWEAMGFVPLAFRTGSATRGAKHKPRVHIFWQKRIRAGDEGVGGSGATPWWFPASTSSGSLRSDRIVLPIPPGVHWSEEMPVVLAEENRHEGTEARRHEGKEQRLDGAVAGCGPSVPACLRAAAEAEPPRLPPRKGFTDAGRLRLMRAQIEHRVRVGELPASALAEALEAERQAIEASQKATAVQKRVEAAPKARKPRVKPAKKADPRLAAMARELRDRWLEALSNDPALIPPQAKYDVVRALPEPIHHARIISAEQRALPRAA